MSHVLKFAAALLVVAVWALPGVATADEWELLGRQKASPGIDRDVIRLSRRTLHGHQASRQRQCRHALQR
jgi:hypothetical protein